MLGDFNRDGIIDIATANRSEIYYDALCEPRQTWDSISILPGTTSGTFTARSDFSIGNQMKPHDTTTDRNAVESLASGDLNGDHVRRPRHLQRHGLSEQARRSELGADG